MKLIIKNLGPIQNNKQAIDLTKRFYVFVGKNNSGKTYVSQLLWTIFNQETIHKFANQIDIQLNFEENKIEISKEIIDEILDKFAIFLKKEIANVYKLNNSKYEKTVLDNFSLSFRYDLGKFKAEKKSLFNNRRPFYTIAKPKDSLILTLTKLDEKVNVTSFFADFLSQLTGNKTDYPKYSVVTFVIQVFLNHYHNTLFLPANRAFYATFYQYIYQFEREQNEKRQKLFTDVLQENLKKEDKVTPIELESILNKIESSFKKPYSEPINELFKKLYSLNENSNVLNHYKALINKLEKLMGGNISTNSLEGIGVIDFLFQMDKTAENLPMYMSSSSVNQLTLLYLYLKYWANKTGNFLMIDEPEVNLHPENQIKLLHILMAFAMQNDNKVLITTHSPLLAEAVNNSLYLDALRNKYHLDIEEIIKENNLQFVDTETTISTENLGAYFFSGTKIIDYVDDNYGVFFRDFKSVTNAVENNNKLLSDFIYLQEQSVSYDG